MIQQFQDCEFHVRTVVDNTALAQSTVPFKRLLTDNLSRQLAHKIVEHKLDEHRGEFCTIYSMDVLVMDHDTFFSLVRKMAAKVQLDPHYLFDSLLPERPL